ncbi:MAG: hypothetical protein HS126_05060 [Anaerolineales bacterium]|nr:hypothetical protein [Anaerolineales bacterium]
MSTHRVISLTLEVYFTAVAVLLTLLSGCNSIPQPQVNEAAPPPSPQPAVTVVVTPELLDNGWYRYTDPELGYSFSYPAETRLKIGKSRFGNHSAQLQFKLPGVVGYQGMVIRVEGNPNDLPIEQMLAQLYQRSAQEIAPEDLLSQVEVITVAGLPGIKTSILPTNTEFSILFLYNQRVYTLAPVHSSTTNAVDPQALELFYQIVESFKVN